MTESRFSWHQIVALGLVMFTVVMTAVISRTVFERMPHLEDELAYLYQAKVFASGHIVAEIPEPRRSYWQPFVVDDVENGTRFGKYTPGWPLALSAEVGSLCAAYTLEQVGTQNHVYTVADFVKRFRTQYDDQGALDELLR